jgi:hypothetical protein
MKRQSRRDMHFWANEDPLKLAQVLKKASRGMTNSRQP